MINAVTFFIALLASDVGARPGQALFERAQASFSQGKFDEARADYQAAYDVEPLPAFLFNIAQCYRNMGDYERAQLYFHRYTVREPRGPNRPAAERLAAEMSKLAEARRHRACRQFADGRAWRPRRRARRSQHRPSRRRPTRLPATARHPCSPCATAASQRRPPRRFIDAAGSGPASAGSCCWGRRRRRSPCRPTSRRARCRRSTHERRHPRPEARAWAGQAG